MIRVIRTDSTNADFRSLIRQLDLDLSNRYGEAQSFFDQFNIVDHIRNVVVAYHNDIPAGCGAFKPYSEKDVEIKRMFVVPELRRKGISSRILSELELWASSLKFTGAILETGKGQHEAIGVYTKRNYTVIENYGQYAGVELSICMRKDFDPLG
jgi:GNAT superfamily N-acetyltransferase